MCTRILPPSKTLAFIILLLILIYPLHFSVRAQSEIPYIYYYSAEHDAFMTSQADGDGLEVMASFAMPEGHNSVFGPGWSKSGRWFAWTSGDSWGPRPDSSAFVFDRLERKTYSLLDGLVAINYLSWSPNTDLLLVGHESVSLEGYKIDFSIIDVRTQETILNFNVGELELGGLEWSPDGQTIILYQYQPYTPDLWNEFPPIMKLFSLDGNSQERTIYLPPDCYSTALKASFSPISHHVIYASDAGEEIILEDLHNLEKTQFEFGKDILYSVAWDYDSSHALIFSKKSCDAASLEVWLLSVASKTLKHISEGVQTFRELDVWSPNEHAAILPKENAILLINPNITPEATPIPFTGVIPMNIYTPLRWTSNGNGFVSIWELPSGETIISSYELESGSKLDLLTSNEINHIMNFAISPMSRYISFSGTCPEETHICIFDTASKTLLTFEPTSLSLGNATEFYWSSEETWVLAAEEVSTGYRLLVTIDIDQNTSKAIGYCNSSPSCFGWMPTP